jgi:putative ABC transport system permease protein
VIGAQIRDDLFGPVDAVGKSLKLGGDSFTIIGVEKEQGSVMGRSLDSNIYIPYTSFLKKYGLRRSIRFRVRASSNAVFESTQDEVRQIMRSRHKLRPNQDDDFDIIGSETIQESIDEFTGAVAMVITPITLISLVVGGIVIMNIMLVTVTERTKEVGMRKAVGAKRSDILFQFLIESALLASAGGGIGILIAYVVCTVVELTTPVPMRITVTYVLLAIATSGGVGLISGIYPAFKASKLSPIVALSRE